MRTNQERENLDQDTHGQIEKSFYPHQPIGKNKYFEDWAKDYAKEALEKLRTG